MGPSTFRCKHHTSTQLAIEPDVGAARLRSHRVSTQRPSARLVTLWATERSAGHRGTTRLENNGRRWCCGPGCRSYHAGASAGGRIPNPHVECSLRHYKSRPAGFIPQFGLAPALMDCKSTEQWTLAIRCWSVSCLSLGLPCVSAQALTRGARAALDLRPSPSWGARAVLSFRPKPVSRASGHLEGGGPRL